MEVQADGLEADILAHRPALPSSWSALVPARLPGEAVPVAHQGVLPLPTSVHGFATLLSTPASFKHAEAHQMSESPKSDPVTSEPLKSESVAPDPFAPDPFAPNLSVPDSARSGSALSARPRTPQPEPGRSAPEPFGAGEPDAQPALLAVVGIGGSAGALDGYERFFLGLPSGGHMAFVVVPHQDPGSRGVMPELLQRCTSLPVTEAADGLLIEPDRVYVAPPGSNVTVVQGQLRLHPYTLGQRAALGQTDTLAQAGAGGSQVDGSPAEDSQPAHVQPDQSQPDQSQPAQSPFLPIDGFLESLAIDQGQRAVAVILSGMGHDGTLGLRAVHARGGLVLVQDPATAGYPSMPASAVATLLADQVLSAEELAARLHTLVTRQPGLRQEDLHPEEGQGHLSAALQSVLLLIQAQTGHDFTQYKQSTILRRVGRRMQLHDLSSVGQYARYLRETPGEVGALYKDLTINVTSFFRDAAAFASLREQARHYLLAHGQGLGTFRVWTPGCSTGEEAYSLAITLLELLEELGLGRTVKIQIFATDIDEDSLAVARAGLYSQHISYLVSAQRLEKYFTLRGETYAVRPEVRELVVFALHNTFGDPPFTRLDLLCCRNVLIYFNSDLQKQLMPVFHYALKPGALLFLGPSETTGPSSDLFTTLDNQWKLFQRGSGASQPLSLNYGPASRSQSVSRQEQAFVPRPSRESDASALINSVLLAESTPPSVVVTPHGEIVHVVGRTGPFLELGPGRIGTNVLEMARDGLRFELDTALKQVQVERREVTVSGLRLEVGGAYQTLTLVLRPLDLPRQNPLYLIVFHLTPLTADPPPAPDSSAGLDRGGLDRVQQLEREIKSSNRYMQANLEGMEVTVEQFKTTNEELQTTNEELQSSNEELMTSKEELQSLNEELLTVNAEHQVIITGQAQANDDMRNLLGSVGIATVFLDNDLHIKRFTPLIAGVIHLIATDVGRPITHLATNLRYEHLERDIHGVLRTLVPFETEVQTHDGDWHLMKIAPYRTHDNFIDGAVIVFTSITAIKRLERQLRAVTLYADEAINVFPDPFIVLDPELRVMSANQAFYRMVRVSAEQAVGRRLGSLGDLRAFLPLEALLLEVVKDRGSLSNHATDFLVPGIGIRQVKLTARHLVSADGSAELLLLTMEDLSLLLSRAAEVGVKDMLQEVQDSRYGPDRPPDAG